MDRREGPLGLLVERYLLVLFAGMTLGVLALGVGHVKERWMIPFLFLAPLYFFSGNGHAEGVPGCRGTWFVRIALAAGILALLASGGRALLGPTVGATTRVNYPFDAVARVLRDDGLHRETILAHNAWFAGNLLKRFPEAKAYVPGFVLPEPDGATDVFVVWDAVRSRDLPQEMRAELTDRFGLDPGGARPEYRTFPYKFGAGAEATVGFLRLSR